VYGIDERTGAPRTPFLRFGDRVRIDMLDDRGDSIFGAIDQAVVRYRPAAGTGPGCVKIRS